MAMTYEIPDTAGMKWDKTFAKLGRSAPARRADEDETNYLRRLSRVGRRYIPLSEDIAKVNFYELPPSTVPKFSELMRAAVERNILRTDNMEPGAMREAFEVDENTGAKTRIFLGADSFVKTMGRPCRRVVSIQTDRGRWVPGSPFLG
jgi:hypothetical protein